MSEVAQLDRSGDRRMWLDWTLLGGLAVLAALLRLDRLMLVPGFTDESMEVVLAMDVLASGRPNLVGTIPYIGGLHTWLLMATIALTGGWTDGPRWLSLVAGVLTVLLTYGLGRELGGRWAGLLAGGLLATNLAHVTLNSRIAWSNCLTPLFLTAALLLLARALRRDQPGWLPLAGLSLGLAMQTHPTVVAVGPGLGLALLLSRQTWRWLRTPWPWLGLLTALVAYGNVLWVAITTGGRSLAAAQELTYAVHPAGSLVELQTNLALLLTQLERSVGSSFQASSPEPTFPLTPTLIGSLLAASLGLVLLLRRGDWLLPLTLVSAILVMGVLGGEYRPLPHGSSRYVAPLWPPLAAMAGLGLSATAGWLTRRPVRALRWLGPALVGALGLAIVALPIVTLRQYLDWSVARPLVGSANQYALETTQLVAGRFPGQAVYLDTALHNDLGSDAGTMHRSLTMLLRLSGNRPVTLRRAQRQTLQEVWEQLGSAPGPVILRRDRAAALRREGATLTPIGEVTRVIDPQVGEVRLYELARSTRAGQ